MRLRTLLFLIVIYAFGLALFVQARRSKERESQLTQSANQLRKAKLELRKERADHVVGDSLGELGIVILRDPTDAEVLQFGRKTRANAKSTGEKLGRDFALKLAGFLLEPSHYFSFSDLPEPQSGVRIWRGEDSIDLLFEVSPPHVDLWVYVKNGRGEIVHSADWSGLDQPELASLLMQRLVQNRE